MQNGTKLGLIARADKTGLGNQTLRLAQMLRPHKILIIDSRPFNNNDQYFDSYKEFENVTIVSGFPNAIDISKFMQGIDAILSCEIFYYKDLPILARQRGIRTYNQYNYEFLDNLLDPNHPWPDCLIAPSKWNFAEVNALVNNVNLRSGRNVAHVYLPPPINHNIFSAVREFNMSRSGKPRFLHTVGRMAVNDRNGTLDLIAALRYTKSDFELVIKVQSGVVLDVQDSRVTVDYSSPVDETELYKDFDALILPRRFAGLCLPMNEALMSGMPVIMTDISPNNQVLPKEWLVAADYVDSFMTRTQIPYYSARHDELAKKIDWFCNINIMDEKVKAYNLGHDNYSMDALEQKYREVLQ